MWFDYHYSTKESEQIFQSGVAQPRFGLQGQSCFASKIKAMLLVQYMDENVGSHLPGVR